jgi:hypothetical protein
MQRALRVLGIIFAIVAVALSVQHLSGSVGIQHPGVWLPHAQTLTFAAVVTLLAFALAKVMDSLETISARLDETEARSRAD